MTTKAAKFKIADLLGASRLTLSEVLLLSTSLCALCAAVGVFFQ